MQSLIADVGRDVDRRRQRVIVRHPERRAVGKNADEAPDASFAALRTTFPSADQIDRFTVFNIGGNKFRLIAAIHYNRKKVYVRNVLTHAEYDRNSWRT